MVVAAIVVAAVLVLLVWRPFDSAPAIATKAVGTWQEQTTADPVHMTVSAAGEQDGVPQLLGHVSGLLQGAVPGTPRR